MSSELSEHPANWDSVRGALAEVRATHGEYQQFFSEVFDKLGALQAELDGRRKQWELQRKQSESELQRQAEQLEADRAELSARQERLSQDARTAIEGGEQIERLLEDARREWAEIRNAQEEVRTQVTRIADVTGSDGLPEVLQEIRQQREELRGAREEAQAQAEQLAAVAAGLSDARAEWTQKTVAAGDEELAAMLQEIRQQRAEFSAAQEASQAQAEQLAAVAAQLTQKSADSGDGQLGKALEEIRQQRDQLRDAQEASQGQLDQLAAMAAQLNDARNELVEARNEIVQRCEKVETRQEDPELDERIQQRLRDMERQQASLQQERTVLEVELDAVRNRAAEMAEALGEQKRKAAVQQAEWADELKRMRRLLEGISGNLAEREFSAGKFRSDSGEVAPVGAGAAVANGDPVLDSVAAQFDMLQKDLARRRAAQSRKRQEVS